MKAPPVPSGDANHDDPDNEFWKDFTISNEKLPDLAGNGDQQTPITVVLVNLDGTDPETVEFNIPATMKIPDATTTAAPPTATVDPPKEELKCNDPAKNPSSYITPRGMEGWANKLCEEALKEDQNPDIVQGYGEDTFDGVKITLKSDQHIKKDDCKTNFAKVIHGCVPAANNPLNYKYGGEFTFGSTTYRIEISGTRSTTRPNDNGKPLQQVTAKCDSFYQFVRDEFWIYGGGYSPGDHGSDLLAQMSNCIGSGVSDWSFEYYDRPDKDGLEWKAFGHTPIWQKNCFSPVIKGSGGPDVPCNGQG